MVGHETLDLGVEVRILPRQLCFRADGFEANERRGHLRKSAERGSELAGF